MMIMNCFVAIYVIQIKEVMLYHTKIIMGDAKHPIRKLGGAPALSLLLPIVWMTDLMKGSGCIVKVTLITVYIESFEAEKFRTFHR